MCQSRRLFFFLGGGTCYFFQKEFILFNIVLQLLICVYGMGRLRQDFTDVLLLFVLCFMFVYLCYICVYIFNMYSVQIGSQNTTNLLYCMYNV